jgi:hypothetical protein
MKRFSITWICCMAAALWAAPAGHAAGTFTYADTCTATAQWSITPGGQPGEMGEAQVWFRHSDCTKAQPTTAALDGGPPRADPAVWTEYGWSKHEVFDFQRTGVGCTGRLISRQDQVQVGTVASDDRDIRAVTINRANSGGTAAHHAAEQFVSTPGYQPCDSAVMLVTWRGVYAEARTNVASPLPPPNQTECAYGIECVKWWAQGWWWNGETNMRVRAYLANYYDGFGDTRTDVLSWDWDGTVDCHLWGQINTGQWSWWVDRQTTSTFDQSTSYPLESQYRRASVSMSPDGTTTTIVLAGRTGNHSCGGGPREYELTAVLATPDSGGTGYKLCPGQPEYTNRKYGSDWSSAYFTWLTNQMNTTFHRGSAESAQEVKVKTQQPALGEGPLCQ